MSIKAILLLMTFTVGGATLSSGPAAVKAGAMEGNNAVIVRIVGRDKTLTIATGSHGRVYSVVDAKGKTLLAAATLEQLHEKFPDLWRQVAGGVASTEDASRGVFLDARVDF